MKADKPDVKVEEQARVLFHDSVERLDAATLSRLNQGRHRALAELEATGVHRHWMRWAPVTGAAAAAVIAVMVMNGPAPSDDAMTVTDFEMLLEEDSLEILDDLEFYSWLETVEIEAGGDVG